MSEEIVKRLDHLIAILQLAFQDQIESARQKILADPISSAIIEKASGDWIDAGQLKSAVAAEFRQSERTVSRRIASLISQHVLEQQGLGPKTKYKATGLI